MKKNNISSEMKLILNKAYKYFCEQQYNIFRSYQLAKFGCLLLTGAVFLIFIHNTLTSTQWSWYLSLSTAYFLPPAGKETMIPLAINRGIPALTWLISIIVFDILVSITIITNWWLIEIGITHSKLISKWYYKIQLKTQLLESRKHGSLLPILLILFMLIPFQGSGAMTSTILGTFLGFKKKEIITIVTIGSIITTSIITYTTLRIMMVIN